MNSWLDEGAAGRMVSPTRRDQKTKGLNTVRLQRIEHLPALSVAAYGMLMSSTLLLISRNSLRRAWLKHLTPVRSWRVLQ